MVFVKKIVRQTGQIFKTMSDLAQAAAPEPIEANSSDTRDIEDYLKSWGLGMYIDKYKEHCVDVDTLQILKEENLQELVPTLGHRTKLTRQIALLKDIVTDAFSDQSTYKVITGMIIYLLKNSGTVLLIDEEQVDEISPSDTYKDCELYKLLSSCNEGRAYFCSTKKTAYWIT